MGMAPWDYMSNVVLKLQMGKQDCDLCRKKRNTMQDGVGSVCACAWYCVCSNMDLLGK